MSFSTDVVIVPSLIVAGAVLGHVLRAGLGAGVRVLRPPRHAAPDQDQPLSPTVAAIERQIDEQQPAAPEVDAETARGLLAHVPKVSTPYCVHCGGLHAPPCPRVRRMIGNPLPDVLMEVEYWGNAEWDRTGILWPDELEAIVAAAPSPALTPEVEE